jgi:hypothetical protein
MEESKRSSGSAPESAALDVETKQELKPWHMPEARIVSVPGVTRNTFTRGASDGPVGSCS